MEGLKYIENIRNYCDYLEEHLNNIKLSWEMLQEKCKDMDIIQDSSYYNFLDQEIYNHDLSKFSKEEFIPYYEYFFPVYEVFKNKHNFDQACGHHIKYNNHHWENWIDKVDTMDIEKMKLYCVLMIIDWTAMGFKFGDTAQEYYEKLKKINKIHLPDFIEKFCYKIFNKIKE